MLAALFAEDPAPQQTPFWANLPFLIAMFALFYLVVLLPMSRRQKKEQEKLLTSISKGARIVTTSGIVGTVVTANPAEDEIVIRSEETKLRIKRHTVAQVLGTDATEASK